MITAITLNAAIDRIYELETVKLGATNRVARCIDDAGGKGMNVAKVLQALGADVQVGGFAGGQNGLRVEQLLDKRGLPHQLIRIGGETRVCLTVLDSITVESTELLESGPTVSADEWEAMRNWMNDASKKGGYFALSGSLPSGLPSNAYAELIEILKANKAKVILDSSGEALRLGIKAKPFAIKPNEHELADMLGKSALSEADLIQAGIKWIDDGVEHICITLGAEGAFFANREGCYRAASPAVEVVNTVGSGDAFVGGLVYGLSRGEEPAAAYKRAIACGAVNASHRAIGYVTEESVTALMKDIELIKIDG